MLDIRRKLFGEEHASTADSYNNLGATQLSLGDFNAALDSKQRALDIHLKLFGKEHAITANSYHNVGAIQLSLDHFQAALCSYQHALDIRLHKQVNVLNVSRSGKGKELLLDFYPFSVLMQLMVIYGVLSRFWN